MIHLHEIDKLTKIVSEKEMLQENEDFRTMVMPILTVQGVKYRLNFALTQTYDTFNSITEAYEHYCIKQEQLSR